MKPVHEPVLAYGPYALDVETIHAVVLKKTPGIFVLGRKSEKNFIPAYIGRSDLDIGMRLQQYTKSNFDVFMFDYVPTSKSAFFSECTLYHTLGGEEGKLENTAHPHPPVFSKWQCPLCSIFWDLDDYN
ncbi:MAG: hypothetical protein UU76_C0007G0029 [Parcubacteria group bacterium GW2011_GWC1_41_7]|nr:MAG: hypothetical protein UU76_C0007G0029 [Parcubacteria group bacterium GW2011_GWC1_41_7]